MRFYLTGGKERGSNLELLSPFSLISASPDRLLGFEVPLCRDRFFKTGGHWMGLRGGVGVDRGHVIAQRRRLVLQSVCVCVYRCTFVYCMFPCAGIYLKL